MAAAWCLHNKLVLRTSRGFSTVFAESQCRGSSLVLQVQIRVNVASVSGGASLILRLVCLRNRFAEEECLRALLMRTLLITFT